MTYIEFYEKLRKCKLISCDWKHLIKLLKSQLGAKTDDVLKVFILYFSLIDDGNVYMSLNAETIKRKFEGKIENQRVLLKEDEDIEDKEKQKQNSELSDALDSIGKELEGICSKAENVANFPLVYNANNNDDDNQKLFVIEGGRLYSRKYYEAVKSLRESIKSIFLDSCYEEKDINVAMPECLDEQKVGIKLSEKQKEIVIKGLTENLLITGGPGTGKTFSIFFLLLELLSDVENLEDVNIYLTAPSGKAANRMKESIVENIDKLNVEYKENHKAIIEKIKGLEGKTVHRLLGNQYDSVVFVHNEKNQFEENSIFVIDEASMIDVDIFASLLKAIPEGARVFILGDKNQLPSVEVGAVYADLLAMDALEENVVELDESKRFENGSSIYNLAEAVNAGEELNIVEEFESIDNFEIADIEKKDGKIVNKIYYYSDEEFLGEKVINVTEKCFEKYFKELAGKCTNLNLDTSESDFGSIITISEKAKILCALDGSARGAKRINSIILREHYNKKNMISGHYPGEIMMITRNNKMLDLSNGDCGVAVTFKNCNNLYLMFRADKKPDILLDMSDADRSAENSEFMTCLENSKIFKIGEYIFYPINRINSEDIVPAFAITIHKSQGSDYENILVILPKTPGHPLLNRQIVYTAITRTKGNTYIISNLGNMNRASKTKLERDTGLV